MNHRSRMAALAACIALSGAVLAQAPEKAADKRQQPLGTLDALFEKFMTDNHVPGLVYGVVSDGKLLRLRAFGVRDTKGDAPVQDDTAFRIASMSKQFTALATLRLRDAGKLSLDTPAEKYVPELLKLRYPTSDSPKITLRDLMSHAAGFVTDDPWGDRQLDTPADEFSSFVAGGVPFSRAPGLAWEYSNFGFALMGRVVTNVSQSNYSTYITRSIFQPLGMTHTGWDFKAIPAGQRAIGYRWENATWVEEPVLGPGEFGAMGGVITTAPDYARYVAWVLNAWPARDGAEDGIVRRASIREITRPANFAAVTAPDDAGGCARSRAYGYGMNAFNDCILGFHFGHSGGLPGYGSNVVFIPSRGLGVYAFTNRTYAPVSRVVRDAANALVRSGAFPERPQPLSPALAQVAQAVQRIYSAGDVGIAKQLLAENVLLDSAAPMRNAQLAELRQKLGDCKLAESQRADSAMSATLVFGCDGGRLEVEVILAPTFPISVQTLEFAP
jgi:D-alanyl-D-alanine-carboxypeptidase/D-alanyl-D-alanine-endopeptidase